MVKCKACGGEKERGHIKRCAEAQALRDYRVGCRWTKLHGRHSVYGRVQHGEAIEVKARRKSGHKRSL